MCNSYKRYYISDSDREPENRQRAGLEGIEHEGASEVTPEQLPVAPLLTKQYPSSPTAAYCPHVHFASRMYR